MASGCSNVTVSGEVVTGQKGRRCHFGPLRGLFKMLRRHRKKKSRINDEVVPGGVCVVRAKSTTALNYSVHGDDSLTCDRLSISGDIISEDQITNNETDKYLPSKEHISKSLLEKMLIKGMPGSRPQKLDDSGMLHHGHTSHISAVDIADDSKENPMKLMSSDDFFTSSDADHMSFTSRDISINEEEFFRSGWTQGSSTNNSEQTSHPKDTSEEHGYSLNLDDVVSTELLVNSAAKARILVKPQARRKNRQPKTRVDHKASSNLTGVHKEQESSPQVVPETSMLSSDDVEERVETSSVPDHVDGDSLTQEPPAVQPVSESVGIVPTTTTVTVLASSTTGSSRTLAQTELENDVGVEEDQVDGLTCPSEPEVVSLADRWHDARTNSVDVSQRRESGKRPALPNLSVKAATTGQRLPIDDGIPGSLGASGLETADKDPPTSYVREVAGTVPSSTDGDILKEAEMSGVEVFRKSVISEGILASGTEIEKRVVDELIVPDRLSKLVGEGVDGRQRQDAGDVSGTSDNTKDSLSSVADSGARQEFEEDVSAAGAFTVRPPPVSTGLNNNQDTSAVGLISVDEHKSVTTDPTVAVGGCDGQATDFEENPADIDSKSSIFEQEGTFASGILMQPREHDVNVAHQDQAPLVTVCSMFTSHDEKRILHEAGSGNNCSRLAATTECVPVDKQAPSHRESSTLPTTSASPIETFDSQKAMSTGENSGDRMMSKAPPTESGAGSVLEATGDAHSDWSTYGFPTGERKPSPVSMSIAATGSGTADYGTAVFAQASGKQAYDQEILMSNLDNASRQRRGVTLPDKLSAQSSLAIAVQRAVSNCAKTSAVQHSGREDRLPGVLTKVKAAGDSDCDGGVCGKPEWLALARQKADRWQNFEVERPPSTSSPTALAVVTSDSPSSISGLSVSVTASGMTVPRPDCLVSVTESDSNALKLECQFGTTLFAQTGVLPGRTGGESQNAVSSDFQLQHDAVGTTTMPPLSSGEKQASAKFSVMGESYGQVVRASLPSSVKSLPTSTSSSPCIAVTAGGGGALTSVVAATIQTAPAAGSDLRDARDTPLPPSRLKRRSWKAKVSTANTDCTKNISATTSSTEDASQSSRSKAVPVDQDLSTDQCHSTLPSQHSSTVLSLMKKFEKAQDVV